MLSLLLVLGAAPAEPPLPMKRPLREQVLTLAKRARKQFVVSPGLHKPIFSSLDEERWSQGLAVLGELFSLEVSEQDEKLRVTDSATFPTKTAYQLKGPAVQVIKTKFLPVDSDVLALHVAVLPETLFSVQDARTLLVGGSTPVTARARVLLETLDVDAKTLPKFPERPRDAVDPSQLRLPWFAPTCDAGGPEFKLKGRMSLGQAVARVLLEGKKSFVVEPSPYFDEDVDVDLKGPWACVLRDLTGSARVGLVLLRDVVLAREVLVSRFGEPPAPPDELEQKVFTVKPDALEFVEELVRRQIRTGVSKSVRSRNWLFVRAPREDLVRLTPIIEGFSKDAERRAGP